MKDNAPQLEKAALPTLVHAGRLTDVSKLQPISPVILSFCHDEISVAIEIPIHMVLPLPQND